MKLNQMQVVLKSREVVGNMYIYTYINQKDNSEIRIGKMIPKIKEVVVEGDNNNIVVPVIPEKITVKGNNNTVRVEEELIVPYFLTPEYKKSKKLFGKLFK